MGSRQPASEFVKRQRARQERWRGDRPQGQFLTDNGWIQPLRWGIRADLAHETLYPAIADDVVAHFRDADIAWHEERNDRYGERSRGPSPNLMDSQVFCLNFWEGLSAVGDEALLAALRVLVPEAVAVDRPTGRVLEPEWIGRENYLGERGKERRRGAFATSADLLLCWTDAVGDRHGLVLESKWSESYDARSLRFSRWGTDRAEIYASAWERFQPVADRPGLSLGELMVDPFDQLVRLTLLARAMEAAGELGCRTVTVAWAAPRANAGIWETVGVPALAELAATAPEAWQRALAQPERFRWATYEALFAAAAACPGTEAWARWMADRYGLGTEEGP